MVLLYNTHTLWGRIELLLPPPPPPKVVSQEVSSAEPLYQQKRSWRITLASRPRGNTQKPESVQSKHEIICRNETGASACCFFSGLQNCLSHAFSLPPSPPPKLTNVLLCSKYPPLPRAPPPPQSQKSNHSHRIDHPFLWRWTRETAPISLPLELARPAFLLPCFLFLLPKPCAWCSQLPKTKTEIFSNFFPLPPLLPPPRILVVSCSG